jgi:serine/threonine protein phosphatase PrpC
MIIQYQKTGSYHLEQGQPCQDTICFLEDESYVIMVLADGATACAQATLGADTASRTAAKYLLQYGAHLAGFSEEKAAFLLVEEVRSALEARAALDGLPVEEYGSTLSACLIHKETGVIQLYFLGDGAAYLTGNGTMINVTPATHHQGCPLTVTKDAHKALRITSLHPDRDQKLMLCSDGVLRACREQEVRTDISQALCRGAYTAVRDILKEARTEDDCSFIVCA